MMAHILVFGNQIFYGVISQAIGGNRIGTGHDVSCVVHVHRVGWNAAGAYPNRTGMNYQK
jgi:hypothetical protein